QAGGHMALCRAGIGNRRGRRYPSARGVLAMLVTGIKSKPVYAPLQADTRGSYHLMIGMGVGAAPLLRVIAEMHSASAQSLRNTRVLFVPDTRAMLNPGSAPAADTAKAGATSAVEQFEAAAVGDVQAFPGTAALLERFRAILGQSLMGTRLYVAGPESFIG